jgi:hypothetical protein
MPESTAIQKREDAAVRLLPTPCVTSRDGSGLEGRSDLRTGKSRTRVHILRDSEIPTDPFSRRTLRLTIAAKFTTVTGTLAGDVRPLGMRRFLLLSDAFEIVNAVGRVVPHYDKWSRDSHAWAHSMQMFVNIIICQVSLRFIYVTNITDVGIDIYRTI